MKRRLLVILSILCLILCLGLVSCGGNGSPGTENGGTENGGTENGGTENNKDYVTITFDATGGSAIESIQVEKGGKIPVPQDPERLGYTFEGWYYGMEQWSFIGHTASENMTLKARWVPTQYTIEYIGANGGKSTYTIEDEFDLNSDNQDFYFFAGWYLDEELTKPISKIEKGTTGNLKLYGKKEYCGVKFELNQGEYTVVECDRNATKVVIPETYNGLRVTSIGNYVFCDCTGLISVVIPKSVTTIGNGAFEGCINIKELEAPTTALSSIPKDSLQMVVINGGEVIDDRAFYNCWRLESITIPNSVTTIGGSAFYYCISLARVDISDIGAWCNISFGNYLDNPLVYSAANLYLNGELVTDLVIPNDTTSINDYAFFGCKGLTSVEIPNSVTTIGEYAFYNCAGFTSVTVGNGVTSIGSYAFGGCTGLTSVEISNSVTTIGEYAFEGCTGLISIIVSEDNPSYKSIDGNLYTKDGKTLVKYAIGKKDTSFVMPSGVTTVGNRAFAGCTSLTSVEIPNSVTSIGEDAFDDCTNIKELEAPTIALSLIPRDSLKTVVINGGETIDDRALSDCKQLESVTIPNSVTTIGSRAFYYCTSLTSVTIPNSVTTIGDYAFGVCTGLTSITIPDSVTTMGSCVFFYSKYPTIYCEAKSEPSGWSSTWRQVEEEPAYFTNTVVWDCKNNDVAINGAIYFIDDGIRYALNEEKASVAKQGTSIITANIKEKISYKGNEYTVTTIGKSAFAACSVLTSVTIPNSVTKIGDNAFNNCWRLESITIPKSVTFIGAAAFYECTRLTIYCETTREPSAWDDAWNYSRCNVVWGYTIQSED